MSNDFLKQTINRGIVANDGTGDTLRAASGKINNNFDDIYDKLGDRSQLMLDLETDVDANGNIISPKPNQVLKFNGEKFTPVDSIENTNFTIKDGSGNHFDVTFKDNQTNDDEDIFENDITIKGGVGITVNYEDPRQLTFDGFDWDYDSLNNKQFIEDNFEHIFTKLGNGVNGERIGELLIDMEDPAALQSGLILKYDATKQKFVPAKDIDTTNFKISNDAEQETSIFRNTNTGELNDNLKFSGEHVEISISDQQVFFRAFDGQYKSLTGTDFIKERFDKIYDKLGSITPVLAFDEYGEAIYEQEEQDEYDEYGNPVLVEGRDENGDIIYIDGEPVMVNKKILVDRLDSNGNKIQKYEYDAEGNLLYEYKIKFNVKDAKQGDILRFDGDNFVPSEDIITDFSVNNMQISQGENFNIIQSQGINVESVVDNGVKTILISGFDGSYESLADKETLEASIQEIYNKLSLNGQEIALDVDGAAEGQILKFDGTSFIPSSDVATFFRIRHDDDFSTIKNDDIITFVSDSGITLSLNNTSKTLSISGVDLDNRITQLESTTSTEQGNLSGLTATVEQNNTTLTDSIAATNTTVTNNFNTLNTAIQTNTTAIDTEKQRIDGILDSVSADKDSFAEIVTLINSVDTTNDDAFAGYVTSNDARVKELEDNLSLADSDADPADGSFLKYNTTDGKYKPTTISYTELTDQPDISGSISSAISTEVTDRNAAISTAISTEVTDRDSAISSAISTEVTNRDNAISTAIDAEVVDRNAAISSAISTEVTDRNNAISSAVTTAINTEVTDRTAAVNSVKSEVDALETNLSLADTDATPTDGSVLKYNTTDGKYKPTTISYTELTDQPDISGSISSAISTEEAARNAAISTAKGELQTKIDTEKQRIDNILETADADKDSFAEIVNLINSVDTTNDNAFGGYVTSNDARVKGLEDNLSLADSDTTPSNNSILKYNAAENKYKPSTISYNELTDVPSSFNSDYNTLSNKPNLFDGDYNSLSNKPSIFDGDYNSLSNKPSIFDGDYNNLSNKPSIFDGDYNNLTNKPSIPSFDGDYNNLTNKPALFDGDYNNLTNKPSAFEFDGEYDSLANKPTLFDGDYDSLTNKPNISPLQTMARTLLIREMKTAMGSSGLDRVEHPIASSGEYTYKIINSKLARVIPGFEGSDEIFYFHYDASKIGITNGDWEDPVGTMIHPSGLVEVGEDSSNAMDFVASEAWSDEALLDLYTNFLQL